jgi:hypothetical protein
VIKFHGKLRINDTRHYQTDFTNDIDDFKALVTKTFVIYKSLNTDRSDAFEDYDGSSPHIIKRYHIENAYFKHLEFLISKFNPGLFSKRGSVELKGHSSLNGKSMLLMNNIRGIKNRLS